MRKIFLLLTIAICLATTVPAQTEPAQIARLEFKRNNQGRVQQIWMFKEGELAQVFRLE